MQKTSLYKKISFGLCCTIFLANSSIGYAAGPWSSTPETISTGEYVSVETDGLNTDKILGSEINHYIINGNGSMTYNDRTNAVLMTDDANLKFSEVNGGVLVATGKNIGGTMYWGSIDHTTVNNQGFLVILSSATNTEVSGGSTMNVANVTYHDDGNGTHQFVPGAPVYAEKTTLNDTSVQRVFAGGKVYETTLNNTAKQYVYSNNVGIGYAKDTILSGEAQQWLYNSGQADDTTLNGTTKQYIQTNAVANINTLKDESQQWVYKSGKATNTILNNNAKQYIQTNSTVENTKLYDQSIQNIQTTGLAKNTTLYDEAISRILAGGRSEGTLDAYNNAQIQLYASDSTGGYAENINLVDTNTSLFILSSVANSHANVDILTGNGNVSFYPHSDENGIADELYTQLNLNSLDGSLLFKMRADIEGNQSDKITVSGTANGQHRIQVINDGSANTTGNERLTVVTTAGAGNENFALTNQVELGGYLYDIQKNNDNWQLYSTGKKTLVAQAASANFLNTGYLMSYIDMQTLLQRMGDLRTNDGQDGNLWIRAYAGQLNSFGSHQLNDYGVDYNGYQIGIDKLISIPVGNIYIGGMFGYNHANPDYQGGTGTVQGYSAGIYGTYIDNQGFYIDTVAKYSELKNKYNIGDTAGMAVSGKGNQKGYSLSIESGKRFSLNQTAFYIEPQGQLTYTNMGSSSNHASNGLKVTLDNYESVLVRGSIIGGYKINNSLNPVDIYVKTGYVRELSGNTSYKLNSHKEEHDFSGGWIDNSVGLNAQFNQQHNVYGELTYAVGSNFDKKQINLGYRYQF